MSWCRSKSLFATVLALFALALQLGLSFGHNHQSLAFANVKALAFAYAKVEPCAPIVPASGDALAQPSCRSSQAPSPGDTDSPTGDCAICAAMSLASAAVHSVAPSVQLPDAIEFLFPLEIDSYFFEDFRRSVFQPRGPPAT